MSEVLARVRLDRIAFDAGTQVRAAMDAQVVTDYAEAMTGGATFPPIVLFHDGTQHYLADGFHRFLAAQRNRVEAIEADVRPGTKHDALWFALGANKANGKRLTDADKRSATKIALSLWPEKSAAIIADHIGCSQSLVSLVRSHMKSLPSSPLTSRVIGIDGKQYPASPADALAKRRQATDLLRNGATPEDVRRVTGIGRDTMNEIRRGLGLSIDKTKPGIQQRHDQMRVMAGEGYTSRQIAAELRLNENSCRSMLRASKVDVPADREVGRSRRHDANRIVNQIVSDAENLLEGVNLIAFGELDQASLGMWVASLQQSREKLNAFIRHLAKEQHGHDKTI